ncbi:hypothetical protein Tco_1118812 [Tanacetum coccineum]
MLQINPHNLHYQCPQNLRILKQPNEWFHLFGRQSTQGTANPHKEQLITWPNEWFHLFGRQSTQGTANPHKEQLITWVVDESTLFNNGATFPSLAKGCQFCSSFRFQPSTLLYPKGRGWNRGGNQGGSGYGNQGGGRYGNQGAGGYGNQGGGRYGIQAVVGMETMKGMCTETTKGVVDTVTTKEAGDTGTLEEGGGMGPIKIVVIMETTKGAVNTITMAIQIVVEVVAVREIQAIVLCILSNAVANVSLVMA